MAERTHSPAVVPRTYAELRRSVEQALLTGQRSVERAKVRTYWESGRLIDAHLLLHKDRAEYGAEVIPKLGRDLQVSERVLYYCVRFARLYPILPTWAELTWGHYRALTHLEDPAQRKAITAAAVRQQWNCRELEARISALLTTTAMAAAGAPAAATAEPAGPPSVPLVKPKLGTPGLHLVLERQGALVIDLGFKLYREIDQGAARLRPHEPRDIVRIEADGTVRRDDEATKADLFTYAARVVRVIDGDTLVAAIRVAPGIRLEEKLRLRGLDCPELATAEGRAAKRFVDSLLAPGTEIVVSTTKPDKYDRYLADVWVSESRAESPELRAGKAKLRVEGSGLRAGNRGSAELNDSDSQHSTLNSHSCSAGLLFLNNALLERGHAVTKTTWHLTDWDKDLIAGA